MLIYYNENQERGVPKPTQGFEERVINCAAGKTSDTIPRKRSRHSVATMKMTDALTRAVFSKVVECKSD